MFGRKSSVTSELINKVSLGGIYKRIPKKIRDGVSNVILTGAVNGTSSDFPVTIKSVSILADFEYCPLYSYVTVNGHLEFPMYISSTGKNVKTKLEFVADELIINSKGDK